MRKIFFIVIGAFILVQQPVHAQRWFKILKKGVEVATRVIVDNSKEDNADINESSEDSNPVQQNQISVVKPILFNTIVAEDRGVASLDVSVANPISGDANEVSAVRKAILNMIYESDVYEMFSENYRSENINDIINNIVRNYRKTPKEEMGMSVYDLQIEEDYQNSNVITFKLTDAIWMNGGPSQYILTVNKSDGRILKEKDIVNISRSKLVALLKQYNDEEKFYREIDEDFNIDDKYGFNVAIRKDGLCFRLDCYKFYEDFDVYLPYNVVEPYLTPLGRSLIK